MFLRAPVDLSRRLRLSNNILLKARTERKAREANLSLENLPV